MTEIKGNTMIIISHLLIILVYIHHNTQVTRPFDVTGMCTMYLYSHLIELTWQLNTYNVIKQILFLSLHLKWIKLWCLFVFYAVDFKLQVKFLNKVLHYTLKCINYKKKCEEPILVNNLLSRLYCIRAFAKGFVIS